MSDPYLRNWSRKQWFTDEQIAAIRADIDKGMKQTEIAEKHGCSRSYVSKLKQHRWKRNGEKA